MYPHRIRLRGPWECQPVEPTGPAARRVMMPSGWLEAGLQGYRGAARFVRHFGFPGKANIDFEHIWITCDRCVSCKEVRLNSQLLTSSPCAHFAFDVTAIMGQRNQLEVLIQGDTEDAGLWGEVALEIRKDAFLKEVRVQLRGDVVDVTGLVIGAAPQALELYTLVDNRHVDYRTLTPRPDGQSFHIELRDLPPQSALLRIELIHVSAIWYVVELPILHWHSA